MRPSARFGVVHSEAVLVGEPREQGGPAVELFEVASELQQHRGRVQDLAAFERSKSVAESRQRYKVQGRNRSCRRNQIRRLIHAVTDFPA
jgi:hypothetical protein